MNEREYISPFITSIFALDASTQERLVDKYQIRKDPSEARQDIMAMFILQRASCEAQGFSSSSTEDDMILTAQFEINIQKAISNARRGEWILVREYLQEEGRQAMATAGPYKEKGGVDDYEKQAQAYFNMAASLIA